MPLKHKPHSAQHTLAYTPDAAALFDAFATPQDSLLLESADIETKKNLTCIAITRDEEVLVDDVRSAVRAIPGVRNVEVELTFEPPWSQDRMSEEAKLSLGYFF